MRFAPGNRDDEFPKPNGASQITTVALAEHRGGREASLEVGKDTEKTIGFISESSDFLASQVRELLILLTPRFLDFREGFSLRTLPSLQRTYAASLFNCSSVMRCTDMTAEMTSRPREVRT